MKRKWNWKILLCVGLLCSFPSWAWSVVPQPESNQGTAGDKVPPGDSAMQSDSKMHEEKGMHEKMGMGGTMGKGGMMGKTQMKPRRKAAGPGLGMWGIPGITKAYHRWIGCLMAQAGELGLTPEQMSRIDDGITTHRVSAIRYGAEAMALKVQVGHALRAGTVDMQAVNGLLMKQAEQVVRMQMEGIGLYTEIQGILTPQQRARAEQIVGLPIPPPWAELAGGHCPPYSPGGILPPSEEGEEKAAPENPEQGESGAQGESPPAAHSDHGRM